MSTGREPTKPAPAVVIDRSAAGKASMAAAGWTIVSRVTGFARAATVAAVLGATYLGNTYQAINQLPNLAFGLLTGGLFGTLLVPSLVRHLDAGDREGAAQLAGGFMAIVTLAALAVGAVAVAGSRFILDVLSIGVDNAAVADAQLRAGSLLLVLAMPQVALYVIAGTATAVLHAHGRFALAAAAPVLENLGTIATLAVWAAVFGAGTSLEDVSMSAILVLGIGSTASVALHASAVVWGAVRAGTPLRLRTGWRHAGLSHVLRLMLSSLRYSALQAGLFWALIVVANSVPGGVVAFMLAYNFLSLPLAIGATSVANTVLPTLSRLNHAGALRRFRDEFLHALGLAAFLAIPAAVAYVVLAEPLAQAVAFGEMRTPDGTQLVAVALTALALGLVAEAATIVATRASFALEDVRSPVRAMVVKGFVLAPGVILALGLSSGDLVLLSLGLAYSISEIGGAWYLIRRITRRMPHGQQTALPSVLRALAGSVAMAGPAYLIAVALQPWIGDVASLIAASGVGAAIFFFVERLLRSPELAFFMDGLRALLPREAG